MLAYDLCIAWNWEHDADFVTLLEATCRSKGLSLLQAKPGSLEDVLDSLTGQQVSLRAFWDRASDADDRFLPIVRWVCERAIYSINPHAQALLAGDKATMHLALVDAGLEVPRAIIMPAYAEQPALPPVGLPALGGRFALKPAHGGGGEGVVTRVSSWEQVLMARQEHPADRYLLQAYVEAKELGARPAWFRVIACTGRVYPCWWDPQTHVYTPVTWAEQTDHELGALQDTALAIAQLCRLDLFSTEIALTAEDRFVVVDYINDPIDLRLQSRTPDGVPDEIVEDIAARLADRVVLCGGPANSTERSTAP